MFTWLFYVHMNAVITEVKMGMGRMGVRLPEEGREWRLPGIFYANELDLCGKLEDDLNVMVGKFAEVCRIKEV